MWHFSWIENIAVKVSCQLENTLRLIHRVNIDRTRLDGDLWSLHYCTTAWLVLAYTADNTNEFAFIHTIKINNSKNIMSNNCQKSMVNGWCLSDFFCFWIITGKGYFDHLLADLSYQWKLWNKTDNGMNKSAECDNVFNYKTWNLIYNKVFNAMFNKENLIVIKWM